MAVTVSNTSASLSGKTLLKAEDNQTITGLKTFNLGVSAPFAVAAGSAKVSNLDADKLDGQEGTDFHDASLLTGTIANARLGVTIKPTVVELTDGATPALDASLATVFELTAAGDRTIAVPTNPTDGQKIIIKHKASGADRTLALNTGAGGFRFGTDVTALTATTSSKTDYIGCIYNGDDSRWDVVAYAKGY